MSSSDSVNVFPYHVFHLQTTPTCLTMYLPPDDESSGFLVVGDHLGCIHIYSLRSFLNIKDQEVMPGCSLTWIASVPALSKLVVSGRAETTKVFQVAQSDDKFELSLVCQVIHQIVPFHTGFCRGDVISNHDLALALPSASNDTIIVDVTEAAHGKVLSRLRGDMVSTTCGMITSLKSIIHSNFLPLLLAAYEDSSLTLWNWTEASILAKINLSPSIGLGMDFDQDICCGVIGGNGDLLTSFEVTSSLKLRVVTQKCHPATGIAQVTLRTHSPKLVLCAAWDKTLRIFSWKHPNRMKPLGALKFHSDCLEAVCATDRLIRQRSGALKTVIATAAKDKKVSLWDIYND